MTQELNCSDGAKMLIERMQTHPKEFWGSGAKWYTIMTQALSRSKGANETYMLLTERDARALCDAFEKYIREALLAEHVITRIMDPEQDRKRVEISRLGLPTASLAQGAIDYEAYLRAMEMKDDHHLKYPHGGLPK